MQSHQVLRASKMGSTMQQNVAMRPQMIARITQKVLPVDEDKQGW